MVALLGENPRCEYLFRELEKLDGRYRYLGTLPAFKHSVAKRAWRQVKRRLLRSDVSGSFDPMAKLGLYRRACTELLAPLRNELEAVIVWGTTFWPFEPDEPISLYTITDLAYDPSSTNMPLEWKAIQEQAYIDFQQQLLQRCRAVFTLSEWARSNLLRVYGCDSTRVHKIGWGPCGSFGPSNVDSPSSSPLFVSVGSEWRRKGMDLVSAAGEMVHHAIPTARTIIVGRPLGLALPSRAGVELFPEALPQKDVHQLMQRATALVVASKYDPSPHVIFEAQQYGTPVIAGRVCGIPEGVNAPKGGLLVDHLTPQTLADAMIKIAQADQVKVRSDAIDNYEQLGRWDKIAQTVHSVITKEF